MTADLPAVPSPERQLRFLQDLQRILDEGSFTATYKFALIHALADLSVEREAAPNGTLTLATREIAEKFIERYWRQVVPFPGSLRAELLRQNRGRQAGIVRSVAETRSRYGDSIEDVRHDAARWEELLSEVDATMRRYPLRLLQRLGNETPELLYRQYEGADVITLLPGVAACFRSFHPLVVDLVQGAWVHFVRHANPGLLGGQADLHEFLFGSERASLAVVRPILADMQDGRCFYCMRSLAGAAPDVDHFIPWWRYPTDLGHNFVLAHASCNRQKSDRLAAERHLERWAERNRTHGPALASAFDLRHVRHDLVASERIVRWAYGRAAELGSLVWVSGKELAPLGVGWERALGYGTDPMLPPPRGSVGVGGSITEACDRRSGAGVARRTPPSRR